MSWLSDIQVFLNQGDEVAEEPATERQVDFIDRLSKMEDAEPFWKELDAASVNIFLTIGEASELIGRVMDHFTWLAVHEGHSPFADPSPFLNDGTRQKDISARVEYLTNLPNT